VIQTVAALDPSQFLFLNCFIHGDDPERMFKKEKASRLKDIDVSDLDLWKADFPINDLPTKNFLTDGHKLGSGELLSNVFPSELDIRFIHVTVYVPVRSESNRDSWYIFAHYSVIRRCR
jgi:hypothetical protein